MEEISTCRAAYLLPFIDILRDIGAPVTRELELAKLPTIIEETPDEFLSNLLAINFLAKSERREGIDDLGWIWSQQFCSSTFSTELVYALAGMPTVKARLDGFSRLSRLEDSGVDIGIIDADGMVEVFCDTPGSYNLNGEHISEWTQVAVLLEVVRSITGSTLSPDEIRFKSDFNVCNAAREANPNTKFQVWSAHTSIVMPSSVLATCNISCGTGFGIEPNISEDLDGVDSLKRLIRPYLREAVPKVDLFAEIVGTSPRSLQRRLNQAGTSYSELVETTRFEMAIEMLKDPDIRLIEVAMALGYENQSNFGRSFRRIAGIGPGKHRREMFTQSLAG